MIQFAMEVFRWISAVLCLLEFVATKDIRQEITFHVHNKAASVADARVICKDNGANCRLPIYQTDGEILSVQNKMIESEINTAWLAINKRSYPSWKWLDETSMDPEFEAQHWREYMRCGTLHLRDRMLEGDNCTIGYYGYVCQTKDLDWCVRGQVPSSRCIKRFKKIYILGCSVENWYDAKYQCERRGMTLATNLNKEEIGHLSKRWYRTKRCNQVWVGFRKDDWVITDNVSSDKQLRYIWDQGQPRYDKDCAVITRSSRNTFSWRAVSCTASKPFLCVCPKVTGEALPKVPESTSESLSDAGSIEFAKIIGIISFFIVLAIAAVVMGFIIFMMKRKSSQNPLLFHNSITSDSCKLTKGEYSCQYIPGHQEDDQIVIANKETLTKEEHKEKSEELQKLSIDEPQQLKTIWPQVVYKNNENNNEKILSTTEPQDLDEYDDVIGEQKPKRLSLCYINDKIMGTTASYKRPS